MQWFLSQHPRIHIHGQMAPKLPWSDFWDWFGRLVRQGEWAASANVQHAYEVAHYAGSDEDRCRRIVKRMFQDAMTGFGPQKPRWGLKWLDLSSNPRHVAQCESLWPEIRWIVCIRDPFTTLCSMKNTFLPGLDLDRKIRKWVKTCRFAFSADARRTVIFQPDRLQAETADVRQAALHSIFQCIEEKPTDETDAFARRWPLVHKVIPDDQRSFQLDDAQKKRFLQQVPDLRYFMQELGYHAP